MFKQQKNFQSTAKKFRQTKHITKTFFFVKSFFKENAKLINNFNYFNRIDYKIFTKIETNRQYSVACFCVNELNQNGLQMKLMLKKTNA